MRQLRWMKYAVAVAAMALTSLAAVAELPIKPPKHAGVYVIAHRGAHEGIPENTLAAYQKAIDLGCDFVEIDVRTTKDGKFISMHNDSIESYVPGQKGKVKDLTFDAIRALDIGARMGDQWKGTKVPTFEEILDLCKGKIGIYLDLKSAPVPELVKVVKAKGMEHDIIWYVGGKQVDDLRASCPECVPMPDPGPEMNLAKLISDKKPQLIASTWEYCKKSFVDTCHAAGIAVIVDEDGTECWKDLLAWGTDGIQTDHPEALIKYLEALPKK